MKKIYSLLLMVTITTLSLFAQAPHKMSYQAIIRDSENQLVVNSDIGIRISVLQGSADGTAVYTETRTTGTNTSGLVTFEIGGNGTNSVTGVFSAIDWSGGPVFIKTETDPFGGTNYTITGTSQLLSVPYAFHAKTAETISVPIVESDPLFAAWDRSTGIVITGSQVSDLQNYLTDETDPLFAASPAAGIVASDIADWNNAHSWGDHAEGGYLTYYTVTVDDVTGHQAALNITESQISDLGNYIETETDPLFTVWDKSGGIVITESQVTDLQDYLTEETDPLFVASPVAGIEAANIASWNEAYSWGDHNGLYRPHNWKPGWSDMPVGTAAGEMRFWNGTEWAVVAPGNEGQVLTFTGGAPTWKTDVGDNFVINFATGKMWMDRNLGASRTATSSTDAGAYGDLYQWGRAADGHQSRTSDTTMTLSSSDVPGHGNFILAPASPYDWRSTQNNNLWQGVNGTNNPCPAGYRLPTDAELDAERQNWSSNDAAGAFASPLKLPVSGYRNFSGSLSSEGSSGNYWSGTVDGTRSRFMQFNSINATMDSGFRASGASVRCIKD